MRSRLLTVAYHWEAGAVIAQVSDIQRRVRLSQTCHFAVLLHPELGAFADRSDEDHILSGGWSAGKRLPEQHLRWDFTLTDRSDEDRTLSGGCRSGKQWGAAAETTPKL